MVEIYCIAVYQTVQQIKDAAPYRERICACRVSELRCNDIQRLLFGRDCADGEFWIQVDEGK